MKRKSNTSLIASGDQRGATAQTTRMQTPFLCSVMILLMMIYSCLAGGPFEASLVFQAAGRGADGSAEGSGPPPPETPLGRSHVLNLLEGGGKLMLAHKHILYSRGWGKVVFFYFRFRGFEIIYSFLMVRLEFFWQRSSG